MRFTYYGYNAFVVEGTDVTVLIDPGRDLHWRRLDSLIPHIYWSQADLILVTHGDADHAEYVPQVAGVSGASVVCGPPLAKMWRRRGLTVVPLAASETAEAAGVLVQGVQVLHGPTLRLGGRTLKLPLVGKGAVGLLVTLEDRRLLNLGDTLLLEGAWDELRPDLLMVPIGGFMTMDVDDALRVVATIKPASVIPVHYNWDILFYHRSVEVERFVAQVRASGRRCCPLEPGEGIEV